MGTANYIPEQRFQCITILIITVSLITGLLIPNIELVLGLVGSTIGVLICIMVPAVLFLCLTSKHNNERLLAQVSKRRKVRFTLFACQQMIYFIEDVVL